MFLVNQFSLCIILYRHICILDRYTSFVLSSFKGFMHDFICILFWSVTCMVYITLLFLVGPFNFPVVPTCWFWIYCFLCRTSISSILFLQWRSQGVSSNNKAICFSCEVSSVTCSSFRNQLCDFNNILNGLFNQISQIYVLSFSFWVILHCNLDPKSLYFSILSFMWDTNE